MHPAASVITTPDTDHFPAYRLFHDAVTRAQLQSWLPRARHLIVDVSGPHSPAAELAAMAGHKVLRVIDSTPASQGRRERNQERSERYQEGSERYQEERGRYQEERGRYQEERERYQEERGRSQGGAGSAWGTVADPPTPASQRRAGADWTDERGTSEEGRRRLERRAGGEQDNRAKGKILPIRADSSRLSCLCDRCADDVIADDRALSTHLAAEAMITEIARVLRPGGRVLACVDSLVLGMAALADQHRWAHLVDLPHADVVLVPWPDGTITRCYGADQARELFTGAGLAVDWIRPRTVFSESMVARLLRRDPASLPKLVRAELAARSDESLGAQLVIAASKR